MGYGDITPKNQLGYAVVVLIIVAVLTVLPWMISGIMDALAQAKGTKQICPASLHELRVHKLTVPCPK